MSQLVIELAGLTKKYGSFTAVDHLSLSVPAGEIFGLLGPNGAGKSTTILMMIGLTEPTAGYVKVDGIDATRYPAEVKKRVGYLPEDVGFYQEFTGLENLVYTARLNGIPPAEAGRKAAEMLSKVGLSGQANKKVGTYSRGMRQRLGLADVLIKSPRVIILDEPTLGLDPEGVRELLELIVNLSREEGLTVLLSSHHLHQVQQVCDRVGVFVAGKLIAQGNIQQLSQELFDGEPFVIEAGVSFAAEDTGDDFDAAGAQLSQQLQQLPGVTTVHKNERMFNISCSQDITPDIARLITASGAGLTHLHRKEYGLDDIYHRYFQGGKEQ